MVEIARGFRGGWREMREDMRVFGDIFWKKG
jgi:hypothetical protein